MQRRADEVFRLFSEICNVIKKSSSEEMDAIRMRNTTERRLGN